MNLNGYYLCTSEGVAIAGPWKWPREAARQVDAQKTPSAFCVMSRYLLAKRGLYPRTDDGDRKLISDLEKNAALPNCPDCGNNRQVWVNQIIGLDAEGERR